jgi:hypothetical protein
MTQVAGRNFTSAACCGLRPEPDCRPRRALLHLLYSCAPPCGPAMLVIHDPERKRALVEGRRYLPVRTKSMKRLQAIFGTRRRWSAGMLWSIISLARRCSGLDALLMWPASNGGWGSYSMTS